MDADHALKQLLEVSEEVRTAVVFDRGEPMASSLGDDDGAAIAALADAMLAYGEALRTHVSVTQIHAVTPVGDVYVARDGERGAVAIATPGSLPGLVQHDLRTLLASLPRARRKAKAVATA